MTRPDLSQLENLTNPTIGQTVLIVEDAGVEQTLDMPRLITLLGQQALGTRGYVGSQGRTGYFGSQGLVGYTGSSGSYIPTPTHNNNSGRPGQMSWDGTFLYFCVATDTWVRLSGAQTSW
jgi:hypothetical protein